MEFKQASHQLICARRIVGLPDITLLSGWDMAVSLSERKAYAIFFSYRFKKLLQPYPLHGFQYPVIAPCMHRINRQDYIHNRVMVLFSLRNSFTIHKQSRHFRAQWRSSKIIYRKLDTVSMLSFCCLAETVEIVNG